MVTLNSRSLFEMACDTNKACKVRVLRDYWMHVAPQDLSLTPHLIQDGYWESWLSLAVARAMQPGWRCVDIGANVGYYTVLMMACGADVVMAIEPQNELANLLKDTVALNEWEGKVAVFTAALGDKPGMVVLHKYGAKTGSASLLEVPGYEVTERARVIQTTLDNVIAGLWPRLDFIKLDAEGAEHQIWQGMQETLKRYSPTIMMEVDDDRGYDREAFIEQIKASGYRVQFVGEDGSIVDSANGRWQKGGWTTVWLTR